MDEYLIIYWFIVSSWIFDWLVRSKTAAALPNQSHRQLKTLISSMAPQFNAKVLDGREDCPRSKVNWIERNRTPDEVHPAGTRSPAAACHECSMSIQFDPNWLSYYYDRYYYYYDMIFKSPVSSQPHFNDWLRLLPSLMELLKFLFWFDSSGVLCRRRIDHPRDETDEQCKEMPTTWLNMSLCFTERC